MPVEIIKKRTDGRVEVACKCGEVLVRTADYIRRINECRLFSTPMCRKCSSNAYRPVFNPRHFARMNAKKKGVLHEAK